MSADFASLENLGYKVYKARGKRVVLDVDVAKLFLTQTGRLNQQVKRNMANLPDDSVFRLTKEEYSSIKSSMSQVVTSKILERTHHKGGRIRPPIVFTEEGLNAIHVFLRRFVTIEKFEN